MALQLGSLRDALISAGADTQKAAKAAEEVAAHDARPTRLDTLATVTVGLLIALLVSQAAIWMKLGDLSGRLGDLAGQQASQSTKLNDVVGQQAALSTKLNEVVAQQAAQSNKLNEIAAQIARGALR